MHDRPRLSPDVVRDAVLHGDADPSSDYDLNPEARAALPRTRALRPAAVLCPIVERDGETRVILTRRADHLRSHSGQVAFPGGKMDEADADLADAALREAEEEIGLSREMVELLGPIDGHETVTGFSVTPFVGFVDPAFAARPDAREVAEVFEPPLAFLMDRANWRRDHRMWQGRPRYFYAMPWEGRYIWGATARMLVGLARRIEALESEAAAAR